MASENVKIKIQEVDKTTAAGRGIDSSDIAFIPGFSSSGSAVKNTPVLCYTVREFEAAFGTQPQRLSSVDVANYKDQGFVAGDPDRSYIIAKELLSAGMPVIYSNVVDENGIDKLVVTASTATDDFTFNAKDNIITCTALRAVREAKTLVFTSKSSKGSSCFDATVATTTDSVKIVTVELSDGNDDKHSRVVGPFELTSGNTEQDMYIFVTISGKLNKDDSFELIFTGRKKSSSRINDLYTKLSDQLEVMSDRSYFSAKYITSGGYPSMYHTKVTENSSTAVKLNYALAQSLITCAATRGDAVALVDYELNTTKDLYKVGEESIYNDIQVASFSDAGFGTAMYPWAEYNTTEGVVTLPASYAYLRCVATAVKSSPNWLAMAGVSRGLVKGVNKLCTKGILTNTIAEEMQPKYGEDNHSISVNCITNIRPYGLTLWGNRTLKHVGVDGTVALNFLNTRNMLSDIKKVLYTTAKSIMFEQNNDVLWTRFKSGVSPLLDQLKSGGGISDYKIIKSTTTSNGAGLSKGELAAIIRVYPIHAVEFFDLTVEIRDDDITVS